jgi:hypothetical protein
VHQANNAVYGARKVWLALNRGGHPGGPPRSHHTSIAFTERLAAAGAAPSVGTVGSRPGPTHVATVTAEAGSSGLVVRARIPEATIMRLLAHPAARLRETGCSP